VANSGAAVSRAATAGAAGGVGDTVADCRAGSMPASGGNAAAFGGLASARSALRRPPVTVVPAKAGRASTLASSDARIAATEDCG